MRSSLEQLVAEIAGFSAQVPELPVTPEVSPRTIRSYLAEHYDLSTTKPLESVIADVAGMMRRWSLHSTHPRYFGLFNPTANLPSVVADALVALYNPQLATWTHAPVANEIERFTLEFLMRHFGLDPNTGFASFTTGGAEANLSAVLVALTHHFPNYGDAGLRLGIDTQPIIYLSEEAHDSFAKIAHITGLGRQALRAIPADDRLKLDVSALFAQVNEDRAAGHSPFLVVGTAGTTSAGIIDPLPELATFCREQGLWFHVDAAWGGAAVLSPRLRTYLSGIELADSITCDAHKWFSVSMGAGMFFCRHRESTSRTFRISAAYMPEEIRDTWNPYTTTIQWSRRFIGLKLFMTLAESGSEGLADRIEHQAEMGELLRRELELAGWEILNETPLPVVCFMHSRLAPQQLPLMLNRLYSQKSVWISATRLRGHIPALRACITSFRTQAKDVTFLVETLEETLNQFCTE
jgi:glutamate/tyrosine decarboxylase-like PLP-dependent enzyme